MTPTAAGWQISAEQILVLGFVAGVVAGVVVVILFALCSVAANADRVREDDSFFDDDERPRLPAEFDWDAFDREREDRLGS